MKTAEFGQPCRAPEPGRCRICGCTEDLACIGVATEPGVPGMGMRNCRWVDDARTLCDGPKCIAAARAELGIKPDVKSEQ